MSTVCPICQCAKSHRFKLCRECYEIYGIDATEWPPYVRFLVSDDYRLEWQNEQLNRYEVTFSDLDPDILDSIEQHDLRGVKIA